MAFHTHPGTSTRAYRQEKRGHDRPHLEWRGALPLARGVKPPPYLRLYTLTLTFPFREIATAFRTDPSFPIRRIKTDCSLADFKLQWTEDGKVASVRLGGSLSALRKTADAVERYVYVEQLQRWSAWERDLLQRASRWWCAYEETRVREVEGWELKEWAGDAAVEGGGGGGGLVRQERWAEPMHPLSRRIGDSRGEFDEEDERGRSLAASERSSDGSYFSTRPPSSHYKSPRRWGIEVEISSSRLPSAIRRSQHRRDDRFSPTMSGLQQDAEEEEDGGEMVWVVEIPASCTLRFCGPSSCTGYIETTNDLSISLSTTSRGSVNLELRAEGKGCRRRLESAVGAVERVVEVDVEGWRAEVKSLDGRKLGMEQRDGGRRAEAGGDEKGKKRKREWEADEEVRFSPSSAPVKALMTNPSSTTSPASRPARLTTLPLLPVDEPTILPISTAAPPPTLLPPSPCISCTLRTPFRTLVHSNSAVIPKTSTL